MNAGSIPHRAWQVARADATRQSVRPLNQVALTLDLLGVGAVFVVLLLHEMLTERMSSSLVGLAFGLFLSGFAMHVRVRLLLKAWEQEHPYVEPPLWGSRT
jgi:membrane glycosyltransferase